MQSCSCLSPCSTSSTHFPLGQRNRTPRMPHELWHIQGGGLEAASYRATCRVQQPCRCSSNYSWQQHAGAQARPYSPTATVRASGAADSLGMMPVAESELLQQQPQQQMYQQQQSLQHLQQHQMPALQQSQRQQAATSVEGVSSRPGSPGRQYASAVTPSLEQPQQPRVPALLAWLPAPLLLHIQSLLGFLRACWELRPEFVSPSLPEALRRLVLVLGASLVMIVVVSTIDSGWLYLYLLNARKIAVAA